MNFALGLRYTFKLEKALFDTYRYVHQSVRVGYEERERDFARCPASTVDIEAGSPEEAGGWRPGRGQAAGGLPSCALGSHFRVPVVRRWKILRKLVFDLQTLTHV